MKISELIAKLQEQQAAHGDIEVYMQTPMDDTGGWRVANVGMHVVDENEGYMLSNDEEDWEETDTPIPATFLFADG